MKSLVVLSLFLLSSCALRPRKKRVLNPLAKLVKVKRIEPRDDCGEIGPVVGESGHGYGLMGSKGKYSDAYNSLKNSAADMGANYVRMDSSILPHKSGNGLIINRYEIQGVAYKCEAKKN